MTVRPHPREIKRLVTRNFLDLGAAMPSLFQVKEAPVVGGGRCIARSYRADGLKAVWLLEEGLLRFHDVYGNTLRTINLYEELAPQAAVA